MTIHHKIPFRGGNWSDADCRSAVRYQIAPGYCRAGLGFRLALFMLDLVIRGGGWNFYPRGIRSANRMLWTREAQFLLIGFRLVSRGIGHE